VPAVSTKPVARILECHPAIGQSDDQALEFVTDLIGREIGDLATTASEEQQDEQSRGSLVAVGETVVSDD
jgi:hypothetical protein